MKRLTALVLVLALSEWVPAQDQPDLEVVSMDDDQVDRGYLLWHRADEIGTDVDNYTVLTDYKGVEVHRWESDLDGGGHTAYLLDGGRLLRMGIRDRGVVQGQPVVAVDVVQILGPDSTVLWEMSASELGSLTFHHDLTPLPNGNILLLTYKPLSADEARAIGWDPGESETVWSDGMIEVKPDLADGSHEVLWEWSFKDHLIQDRAPDSPNYGVVKDHPERIDPHYPTSYAPMNIVRQHLNSVDYNPGLDQIVVSSFIYNEIWIIDHSTTTAEAASAAGGRGGKGGDLLFRYGNPEAYGMGSESDRVFLKQHDANWIDLEAPGEGNLIVHNNNTVIRPGMLRRGGPGASRSGLQRQQDLKGVSNVQELRLPVNPDGIYAREEGRPFTAERVWFWENPGYFAPFQGGARRLSNGNTLISNTVRRQVLEVARDKEIVAEYKGSAPTYKSFKYPEGYLGTLLAK